MTKGSIGDPNLPMPVKLLTAGIAGCIGEVLTIPLDTAKVRLQIAGTQGITKYKGLIGTMKTIAMEEGPQALFKGLSSGLCRQIVFCSIRIGSYDTVRNAIVPKEQRDAPSLFYKIMAGLTTGAMGILIANPTDVVKVRLQAQGKQAEGVPKRYNGMVDAYRKIFQQEGLKGFWTGCTPNVIRNSIFNACELATYDQTREFILTNKLMNDNIFCHFVVSATAGIVTVMIGQPIDQIKTRIMNQSKGAQNQYSGVLDCIVKTVKNEGPMAFYDGVTANASRVVSWNIIMFVSLQQLRGYADIYYFPQKYKL